MPAKDKFDQLGQQNKTKNTSEQYIFFTVTLPRKYIIIIIKNKSTEYQPV